MKARELAELLMQYPDLNVYVRGYEGGVDLVEIVAKTEVTESTGRAYCGNYITRADSYDEDNPPTFESGLFIGLRDNIAELVTVGDGGAYSETYYIGLVQGEIINEQ